MGRDDLLLERLGRALDPPAVEPSERELAVLRDALAGAVEPRPVVTRAAPHARGVPVRLALAAAAAVVAVLAAATGWLATRDGGRDDQVATPVELETREIAVRTAVEELEGALRRGDPREIADAVATLRRRMEAMPADWRPPLRARAEALLLRAEVMVRRSTTPGSGTVAGPGGPGASTTVPVAGTVAPPRPPGAPATSLPPVTLPPAPGTSVPPVIGAPTTLPGVIPPPPGTAPGPSVTLPSLPPTTVAPPPEVPTTVPTGTAPATTLPPAGSPAPTVSLTTVTVPTVDPTSGPAVTTPSGNTLPLDSNAASAPGRARRHPS